jgi:hypothetical protein
MIEVDWPVEEAEKLKRLYPEMSNKELSVIFNRSINSIQHKANRMNLHKSKECIKRTHSECRSGEKCCAWKGGKKIDSKGHVLILKKGYPGAGSNGYIMEHRYVMEQFLGRQLKKCEIVHHKNGIKDDNRIENLEIMTNGEHTRLHHTGSKRSLETRSKISIKAKLRKRKGV